MAAKTAEKEQANSAKPISAWGWTLVWLCRLAVGAVFIVSGWAKAIDPSGFIIKVGEYLAVWNWDVPHEAVVAGCVALAAAEFATGLMLATGSFKRVSVWFAAAMMAFMLPLTAYIALFNPVPDCGCFGDFIILSNQATFAKNVVITALVVVLLIYNRRVKGLYPAPIQWLLSTVTMAYPLCLSFIGYHVQPLADFRPFSLGTVIFHPEAEAEGELSYVYERDGQRAEFSLENLPDSTWTFVEVRGEVADVPDIAVRDEDGEDVSYDLVSDSQPQAWLIIPNPGMTFLTRSHYVNELYNYLEDNDIDFVAIVGSRDAGYRYWRELLRPRFPIYSAEDTALEQLARGNAALVYTRGGRIVWKRTITSLPDNLIERSVDDPDGNVLDTVSAADDGTWLLYLTVIFGLILSALYLLGLSPKLLHLFTLKRDKPSPTPEQE